MRTQFVNRETSVGETQFPEREKRRQQAMQIVSEKSIEANCPTKQITGTVCALEIDGGGGWKKASENNIIHGAVVSVMQRQKTDASNRTRVMGRKA